MTYGKKGRMESEKKTYGEPKKTYGEPKKTYGELKKTYGELYKDIILESFESTYEEFKKDIRIHL